jgi:hypothetical protein
MPSDRKLSRIDFQMSEKTAARLAELQDSIRAIGHSKPTPRTLLSALIMSETRRGADLEQGLLMPFRVDQEDAE